MIVSSLPLRAKVLWVHGAYHHNNFNGEPYLLFIGIKLQKKSKFNFKFIHDDMNFDLLDDISLEVIKH
jgi:hypothetical protein